MKLRLLSTFATAVVIAPLLALGASATARPATSDESGGRAHHPSVRFHRDGLGDGSLVPYPGSGTHQSRAPGHREGDIRSLRVAHAPRTVTAQVKVRAFHRSSEVVGYLVTFRTNKRDFDTAVITGVGLPGDEDLLDIDGHRCKGSSYRFGYARDLMRITVPRRCLSYPRWVRADASVVIFGTGDRSYVDMAPATLRNPNRMTAKAWHPGA